MDTKAQTTRDKLLDAATRLFAERGIFSVPLAEIVRAAGQRNVSAIHYYFGGRDQVLLAIMERHVPAIGERRLELMAKAEAMETDDPWPFAEAIVRPVMELAQRGWRERAYLQIGAELISYLDRTNAEMRRLLQRTAGYDAMDQVAERCPPMPPDIWAERVNICHAAIGRAAADHARMLDRHSTKTMGTLSGDTFVANLTDMVVGALTFPATKPEDLKHAR